MFFNLREYRRGPVLLADLLPWGALIAPGTVYNKDGSVQKTYRFRGPDLASSTTAELGVQTLRANNALKRLDARSALYIEARRRPAMAYPDATWPHPVAARLDEERRQAFVREGAHFESVFYLTLQYCPPPPTAARWTSWFYDPVPARQGLHAQALVDSLHLQATQLGDLLQDVLLYLEPLSDAETLTYLHATISPKDHLVRVPPTPMYLDALLADSPLTCGVRPMLGPVHLRTVTLRAFPDLTTAGMLDALNHLPFAYRWMTRYLPLDKTTALRDITSYRRRWYSQRKSFLAILREAMTVMESPLVDNDALNKALDSDAAHQEVASDVVSYGAVTATVTVWDADSAVADARIRAVERVVNAEGFVAHVEDWNAVEAWLGSLPGNRHAHVRRPLLSTMNLAHMLPLSAVWAGPERNAHLGGPPLFTAETDGATPFRLSTHVGDVGHTLVFGPTGSGKSVLLALMAVQFLRYPQAQVYVFDKGGSARAITLSLQGDYYALGSAACPLQPLAAIDGDADRRWAATWVLDLLALEGVTVTPAVQAQVWSALTSLARVPPSQRTLTGYLLALQDTALRQALEPYTMKGPHGVLLDADHEPLRSGTFQCFELGQLLETPRLVPPVLAYLFHRLEQRFTGVPTLLILDEAWLYLEHPLFAARLRDWLRTLRKQNVSVVCATQSIADAATSPLAPLLLESCPTRIFLPNPRALEPAIAALYTGLGLNAQQRRLLSTATPKRHYYLQAPQGTRLFELALDQAALACCAASRPEDHALMDRLLAAHGPQDFPSHFLRHKGVPDVDHLLKECAHAN